MKHLKKFNEISTGLAYRAHHNTVYHDKENDNDPIMKMKINKQRRRFSEYVNPSLKEYLYSKGIVDIIGNGDGITIKIPSKVEKKFIFIRIWQDRYDLASTEVGEIPDNMISGLPNIIKRIQADIKGEKGLYNPAGEPKAHPEN